MIRIRRNEDGTTVEAVAEEWRWRLRYMWMSYQEMLERANDAIDIDSCRYPSDAELFDEMLKGLDVRTFYMSDRLCSVDAVHKFVELGWEFAPEAKQIRGDDGKLKDAIFFYRKGEM